MYKKQTWKHPAVRFKQFANKSYAVFNSLNKEVAICVLSVQTLSFASPTCLSAQTENHMADGEKLMQGIEVTGTRVPLTETEAARLVTVLDRATIENAPVQSVNDLLKYASGIDVRQRGAMGIQTDISIHGGTFDQITILLNGVNISNPQTGHLTADFPVAIEDIERIEILEGPAARVYGTSAFCGAINIVTSAEKQKHIQAHATGGSYRLGGGGLRLNLSARPWTNQVSGSYLRTDGATPNSDFNVWRTYYQGGLSTPSTTLHWQAGFSRQQYGANTFYSAKYDNQYEETARYLVSVRADTKVGRLHLQPTLYWNRSADHYQLIRHTSDGENFHRTDVYGLNVNACLTTVAGKTALGMEMRSEGIYLNVPDFYFLNGSSKTSIGYREVNWSLPRDRQLVHTRQLNYDCTWERIPSSLWSFVPLVEYHGGGAAATLEPLHEHLDEYRTLMFQNYGAGIQACYRGPRLYDSPEVKEAVKEIIAWYKRYRRILNSDIIHLRKPDARDWDGIMHVDPSGREKALALFFNPTSRPMTRTITLPLYYTGLKDKALIREQEGQAVSYSLDARQHVTLQVEIPANGYTWYVVE